MPTVKVHDLVEAAVRLGTVIDAHVREAGRQLGAGLRPWLLEGEALPDFALALELPARRIRQAGHCLRRRQQQLEETRNEERQARFRQSQTAAALRRKLVDFRRLLTSAFGPLRAARLTGIEGKTARVRQPALLLAQADAFLELAQDPRRSATLRRTRVFDPAAVAEALEPLAGACRSAGGDVDRAQQAVAQGLDARDRARAELERSLPSVVDGLCGWLRLIGRGDLAEKLRRI